MTRYSSCRMSNETCVFSACCLLGTCKGTHFSTVCRYFTQSLPNIFALCRSFSFGLLNRDRPFGPLGHVSHNLLLCNRSLYHSQTLMIQLFNEKTLSLDALHFLFLMLLLSIDFLSFLSLLKHN